MKKYMFVALSGLMLWAMSACNPNTPSGGDEPESPQDTSKKVLPTAFVKKHLIEEFTGQDCGYCPYGMDCVHEFVKDDPNWIVVLHHYGYSPDHFSVAGSQRITNNLGVSGAPNITVDRSKTKYAGATQALVFHPGYLPELNRSQFADSTYVSLNLTTVYYSDSRKLRVQADGLVLRDDNPNLKLTILIKESGMIDYQEDNYYTFEGWQEFRHANAVRAYLTEPLGDALTLEPNTDYDEVPMGYAVEYETVMNANWNPENSSVVAIITESTKPVVQAAQQAIMGKGGADIVHGGITPVPVPDYYPEPGADVSPFSMTQQDVFAMSTAYAEYTPYSSYGINFWQIIAYNASTAYTVSKTKCLPCAVIYLVTSNSQTDLPLGTLPLNLTEDPGTAVAGYRDDEYVSIGGSMFFLISQAYFAQGYLVPQYQWLIADGTLTITEQGWQLTGHARNGSDIRLVGTTAITNYGQASSAPQRVRRSEPRADFPVCIPDVPAKIVNRK